MASEVELLEAWRAGDARAGNALFERYFSPLFRFFRSKTDTNAEDLVQETFMACVRGRDRIEGSGIRGYLFGSARHVLYRHIHQRVNKDEPLDFGVSSLHDLGPTPSNIVAKREEHRLLVRALRRIPVELQIAVELYYFEELTGPELAVALGIPEGTARSRVRRAVELLEDAVRVLATSQSLAESTIADLDTWAKSVRELLTTRATPRA